MVTFAVESILARHGLSAPDGRMLHAYCVTDEEFAAMSAAMANVAPGRSAGRIFVLWAAEEIRRNHASGALTWDFLLDRLGLRGQREAGKELVVSGMAFWHRKIRKRASDQKTLYLFSLMAEGGLPDAFLARGSGYAAAVLGAIGQIEREAVGSGDIAALDRIAARCSEGLPAAFQAQESKDLLRDLAMAFVELRRALPDMPSLEAALLWLDRNQPGWTETLPLRLSSEARQAILLPALSRQVERPPSGSLSQRLLVPAGGGRVWAGAVRILRGGLLPFGLLPTVDRTLVLRLVAAEGSVMRASPETGGWRLEAPRDLVLPLDPWAPVVFTAYADGVVLAEVVVDPGLPETADVPLFWRAEIPVMSHAMPQALVPASGGKSRSERLWLLATDPPRGEAGIVVHDPMPGPGGQVWPLSGEGRVWVGGSGLSVATGADADSPTARLLVLAASPREARVAGGLPAYSGTPRFLGAREDLPLRDVTAQVREVAGRSLGACRFDWIEGGEVIASTRAVLLPAGLAVSLRESGSGLDVEVAGLPQGWRLAVELGPIRHVVAMSNSRMTVGPVPASQGEVGLEFFDAEGPARAASNSLPTTPCASSNRRTITPDGACIDCAVRAPGSHYGFADTRERLDLLALDANGQLVVIENKLDDSGRDVAWQALKYAAYVSSLTKAQIVVIYQQYLDRYCGGGSASEKICEFLEIDTLDDTVLNAGHDQRLMFIAANFRKEVTSTVLWLREHKIDARCFKVTPYQFGQDLFIDIQPVIPTPEAAEFMISMAEKETEP